MPPFPKKLGIILFNLGGPVTQEDIAPFLLNLFRDPDIIPIPFRPLRHLVARGVVAARLKNVKHHYAEIGGGSPLRRLTEEQAAALEKELRTETGSEITVRAGMRYWNPFTEEVINEFTSMGIRDVFLLPLYPQYSDATSGSSFKDWKYHHSSRGGKVFRVRSIRDYFCDPDYIAALSETIDATIDPIPESERSSIHLLFSAHGLPAALIEGGDPYQRHILATIDAVMNLRDHDYPHHISYQSKVGPVKWLKPSTIDTLQELGKSGVKNLIVIPVAFVSDHIETLHELDIELREIAEHAGITRYAVTPGLNSRPAFIKALAKLVRSRYS